MGNHILDADHIGPTSIDGDHPVSTTFGRLWKRSPPMRGIFPPQEDMLRRAHTLLRAHEDGGFQNLVAQKAGEVARFDVPGMQRIVAIIACGRGGADLLASYLDGHDEVLMIPPLGADRLYQFFERYRTLSLRDKLISYPVFTEDSFYSDFFNGAFPIGAAEYFAAVNALLEAHKDHTPAFLESSRTFILFLHVAYCMARGQRPTVSRPLIVYAQHAWNSELARRLVHDFPEARFIHTVRDPITNCVRAFQNRFNPSDPHRFLIAAYVLWNLTQRDVPQQGMEARTVAVRFEDLHTRLEETIRAVADWLGLSYRPSLLQSTYNGVPWVVTRGKIAWTGVRVEQSTRDVTYTSFCDRALLFALLREGFVAWNYPCPAGFAYAPVRFMTCITVALIPTKIERISARHFVEELSTAQSGFLRHAAEGAAQIVACRMAIILLVLVELGRRLVSGNRVKRLAIICAGHASRTGED
jgi:hypothetical protein